MKKGRYQYFSFILFFLLSPLILNLNVGSVTQYSNDVPPESEIVYTVEVNTLSLQSITIFPDSNTKKYHVEILNQNHVIIISRYNVDRSLDLRFTSNNSYTLKISNPLLENLYIDVILSTTPLEKRDIDGYYFESSRNWCWISFISSEQMKIISLSDLKAGKYLAEVAVIDDKGFVGLYITDQNPLINTSWYKSTFYFSCTTFTSRRISINRNEDWLIIFSQDDKPHDIIITFTTPPPPGREFTSSEIAIIVVFFAPIIILLFLRVRRKKSKITRDLDHNDNRIVKETNNDNITN